MQRVLAVDPGREKCGLAVVDRQQGVLAQKVIATAQLTQEAEQLVGQFACRIIVIGDRTANSEASKRLERLLSDQRIDQIVPVDEHRSSLEAKDRYWRENPPAGWRRLLPQGLLSPPCAIDAFAAIILAERYFQKSLKNL
jgi:RNase H-fold protein (predicted Holliday junction resolvase)